MAGRVYSHRAVDKFLLAVSLINGIGSGFSWAILAPYLRGLGVSGALYGLLGGVSVIVSVFSTLSAGVLCDLYGSKVIAFTGLLLYSSSFLLFSTKYFPLIAVGYLVLGFSRGFTSTSINVLTSRSANDEILHYTFSYVRASSTLGGAIGSFLGWVPVIIAGVLDIDLVSSYGFSLLAIAPLSIMSALLALKVRESYRLESIGVKKVLMGFRGLGRFNYIVLVGMLIGFGAAMSIHNIGYYFTVKYGVTSGELGSIFGLQQLIMAFMMAKMPAIADKYGGPLKVYLVATYSSIPLLIAMTLTNNYVVASMFYLIRSILMNVANPLYTAFAMRLVPVDKRGVAGSLLSLSWNLPAGIGRAIGGALLDIDLEAPLRLTATLYIIGLTIIAITFKENIVESRKNTRS